jgi:hypothetical protein
MTQFKKWSIEEIKEESKKYKNLTDFKNANQLAYEYAKFHKIVNELYIKPAKVKPELTLTFEQVKLIIEQSKVPSRSKLSVANYKLYEYAKDKGWLDILLPAKRFGGEQKFTDEEILAELSQYETKGILKLVNPRLYARAYNRGLMAQVFGVKEHVKYAPLEIIEFLKTCKTRNEVYEKNSVLYYQAKKSGLLDMVIPVKFVRKAKKQKVKI